MFIKPVLYFHAITHLVEIGHKTIMLKKSFIIRRVIIHSKHRCMKPLNQQSPPSFPFTEVDGPVHSFHTSLPQPLFAMVKHEAGARLIINTIEKAYSTGGLRLLVLLVDKSGNTAN